MKGFVIFTRIEASASWERVGSCAAEVLMAMAHLFHLVARDTSFWSKYGGAFLNSMVQLVSAK